MAGNTSTPGASVVSRVVAILSTFDDRHRRLSLTEISERSGLPLPTTHRLVRELVAGDLLQRRATGEYAIGRRTWDLGTLAPVQTGLRQVASPFLSDLYAATLATVHLAVRDGDEVLYLDRFSGRASVPVVSQVGTRLPMHATGVGKVLLAHAPDEVQQRVLGSLRRVTSYTITQPRRLAAQLERVRRDGYATTVEEMTLGACSVAVPIVRSRPGASGEVVAALGIVVPDLKRNRARFQAALAVAAQGIGRSLP